MSLHVVHLPSVCASFDTSQSTNRNTFLSNLKKKSTNKGCYNTIKGCYKFLALLTFILRTIRRTDLAFVGERLLLAAVPGPTIASADWQIDVGTSRTGRIRTVDVDD